MRMKVMIVLSILVLAALNYGIYEKQKVIENGEVVLLELAPVDPRSLMQGDYMRLRYAIERSPSINELPSHQTRGDMVIRSDENGIAQYVRFYGGEKLKEGEKIMHFHSKHSIRLVPDSFLFQEGHAKYYENAKYGVFKFSEPEKYLLVGLADENMKTIVVTE